VPEVGEELLVVANEKGMGTHGGEETLGAGEEGVEELDLAVFVLAVIDEGEEGIEASAKHVDLGQGFERGHVLEEAAFGFVEVAGIEAMLEGVLVVRLPAAPAARRALSRIVAERRGRC
jgi:hypothetical protein